MYIQVTSEEVDRKIPPHIINFLWYLHETYCSHETISRLVLQKSIDDSNKQGVFISSIGIIFTLPASTYIEEIIIINKKGKIVTMQLAE